MSGKTIVEIYTDAVDDCIARAEFYQASASKNFEERRFELSDYNLTRSRRWWRAADEYARVVEALRGNNQM